MSAPARPLGCDFCRSEAVAMLVDTRPPSFGHPPEVPMCAECLAVYYTAREADEARGIDYGPNAGDGYGDDPEPGSPEALEALEAAAATRPTPEGR